MKVLEKGKGWSIEKVCTGKGNGGGGCEAKLLIERGDIYQTSSTDYLRDTDYYYTFRCPECGIETDIAFNELPGIIISEAKTLRRIRK